MAKSWIAEQNTITKEFKFTSFGEALRFMAGPLLDLADQMNHHSDLRIYGYNRLKVVLSTHDKGGVTDLDNRMAEQVDKMYGVWNDSSRP